MKKERIQARIADLVLNEGQLDWLPRNPRQWTQTDIDRTKRSLERDPDFQEDNPLKVVPLPDGRLLVFAGNLRTTAARSLDWDTFEAMRYEPETEEDRQTIIRRALLDNGSFGAWDVDRLANEWEAAAEAQGFDLPEWGVPEWVAGTPKEDPAALAGLFEQAGEAKPKPFKMEVEIPLAYEEQQEDIAAALTAALEKWPGCKVL